MGFAKTKFSESDVAKECEFQLAVVNCSSEFGDAVPIVFGEMPRSVTGGCGPKQATPGTNRTCTVPVTDV